MVSPSLSCHSTFSPVWQDLGICILFCFSLLSLLRPQNPPDVKFFSSRYGILVFWPRLGDPFVSQRPREFYASLYNQTFLHVKSLVKTWWRIVSKAEKSNNNNYYNNNNHTNKWYTHNLESALENEMHKILWDLEIQTDHLISVRPPIFN